MKKFVCSVCGYVHTAEELAADFKCPVCKVPATKFNEMTEQKVMLRNAITAIAHKMYTEIYLDELRKELN